MKKSNRIYSISKEIQKNLSIILQYKMQDPRIYMVTISDVRVSQNLEYAKVFVSFFDTNFHKENFSRNIKLLQHASGFIRNLLSKNLSFRKVPKLMFIYDSSLLEGMRISSIISKSKLHTI